MLRFWAVVGLVNTVIGFAGVPDNLSTWQRWLNRIVSDPLVLSLAEKAVAIAEFINQGWFRWGLVVIGLLMIIWPLRWFWRLRRKISFRWRRILAEQVWISRDDALKVIRESPWGRLKEPNIVRTVSVLDALSNALIKEHTVEGMSETQRKRLKYELYLERTLDGFCTANPSSCRVQDGVEQVDETALRAFLRRAIDEELKDEFGEVPQFKVT